MAYSAARRYYPVAGFWKKKRKPLERSKVCSAWKACAPVYLESPQVRKYAPFKREANQQTVEALIRVLFETETRSAA